MSELDQSIARDQLALVRRMRGESLAVFGRVLAATVALDHAPFSKQYIDRLERGQDRMPAEIVKAVEVLAAMLDGVSELQARARRVVGPVYAVNELPAHTIILGAARGCKLPGCRVQFVPASPRQVFCGPDCRREYWRRVAAGW